MNKWNYHRSKGVFYFFIFSCALGVYLVIHKITYINQLQVPSNFSSVDKKEFFPSCKIPKLDIWPKDIRKINLNVSPLDCEHKSSEWFVIRDKKIYFTPHAKYYISKQKTTCELRVIDVKEYLEINSYFKNRLYDIKKLHNLTDGFNVPSDVFSIHCINDNSNAYVFENVYLTIKPLPQQITKNKPLVSRSRFYKQSIEPKYNILIWCFDSVSKLSWKRFLPETVKTFQEIGGIWFNQFNILGYGTTETFIPMLTGKVPSQLHQAVRGKKNARYINDYPWVWHDLKTENYSTLFADGGSFNWKYVGFEKPPTDHYARPFFLAAKREKNKHQKYCLKSKPRLSMLHDYVIEFWKYYQEHPKFALINYEEMSHDYFSDIKLADKIQSDWLHKLLKLDMLNNTILILMSDHGGRHGPVRRMKQSGWEIINPYLGIRLSESFLKLHPKVGKILEANKNLLVTPLDIHKTLKDVLRFSSEGRINLKSHDKSLSLFSPIPRNRTCKEAIIRDKLCFCDNYATLNINDNLVQLIVKIIETKTIKLIEPIKEKCKKFKIIKINEAYKIIKKRKTYQNYLNQKVMFKIKFTVDYFNGTYESHSTVTYSKKMNMPSIIVDEINRLDRYGSQADCVEREYPSLALFCFCKK